MKMNMYSVYDETAKVYGQVFLQMSDDVAKRTLSFAVNTKEHNYGMFPEDFSLFKVGVFDDQDGTITPDDTLVCVLAELKLVGNDDEIQKAFNQEKQSA